jgi:hypothetical protein
MTDYATLLRGHTTLTCRCIDRIFLQAYLPRLQSVGQVCNFLHHQKGFPIPSSAAFGRIGEAYVRAIHGYAKAHDIPVVHFDKGDKKEKIARPLIEAAAGEGGSGQVVLLGIAQEKASAWCSWVAQGQRHLAHPHMEWRRQMKFPNHFYWYLWDPEWGGAFLKTNASLTKDDMRAGYVYDLAFRQFEVSDTRVLDRPQQGRAFFEGVIRDHLDIGRPESVELVFRRPITKRTPGTFRTRVITKGVEPHVTATYKSSRIKQYFKEHKALRTETTINDTRDFGIGRRVRAHNWRALKAVGCHANTRLLDAQAQDARPVPDVATFDRVTRPSMTDDGLYAPSLRFGDPRVMAILVALCRFSHVLAGFTNASLCAQIRGILGCDYTSRQATYDLRRLTRTGLIARIDGTFSYELTPLGRRVAVLFAKTYGRVLTPGLAALSPRLPPQVVSRSPLATAWRSFDRALDDFIDRQMTAA